MVTYLNGLLLFLIALFTVFPLFLSVLSKIVIILKDKKSSPISGHEKNYACVITVYKDIDCAQHLVLSLLGQHYPHFHIYLVADDCDSSRWTIKHPKLSVLQPERPLHSKVRSIRYALDSLVQSHSHFIVFDPDNLAHPDFLHHVDKLHLQGYEVVQGKRVAKNLDTKYACLDAFSEYYYNYTQRTVTFSLGSSATIAGSGMSIPIALYHEFLQKEFDPLGDKVVIAEDKMLQVFIVEKKQVISFAEEAILFDEKVSTAHQVKRQRTRWITSYFQYLLTGLGMFGRSVLRLNWNQILFAYTIVIPPMFIIGLGWLALSVLYAFTSFGSFVILQSCFAAFILNIFVALILGGAPNKVTTSLFYAPLFVWNQIKAMLSMKDTKTSFLTTEKTKNISVEDLLNSKP